MYLSIVANVISQKDLDQKIFLKRVSRIVEYKQMSHNQHFTDCATSHCLLKQADWHNICIDVVSLTDLKLSVACQYNLEDNTTAPLVLRHKVGKKSERWKCVTEDDDIIPLRGMLNMYYKVHRLFLYILRDKLRQIHHSASATAC